MVPLPIKLDNNSDFLLTVDVEDWFQVENLRPNFPMGIWDRQQYRVEQNTHRLLDLFDSIQLKNSVQFNSHPRATFFVLGWIAKRFPRLVSEIASRGHEVASHGYNHLMCNQLNKKELRDDLSNSKKLLQDILGKEVKGYRAPSFSISDNVMNMVKEAGYFYDSSYNSFDMHGRYGSVRTNGFSKVGIAIQYTDNFFELPLSNLSLFNKILPWGGGGYFRFYPTFLFLYGCNRILQKTGAFLFYLHPWEIDPNQPRISKGKGVSTWRHYINIDKTYERLKGMILHFNSANFKTCYQYLNELNLI